MSSFRTQLRYGLWAGAKKGQGSFVWICRIIIPVSFLVTLVKWGGLLNQVDALLNPLMGLINLPGEAALPILTGALVSFYAAIAIITTLPFTLEQMTLIAVFLMVAHELIMEGIIQRKCGISITKIVLVRITAAILAVLVVSQFFSDTTRSVVVPTALAVATPFVEVLKTWALDMVWLLIRILVIIMAVMMALESMKSLGWTEYLLRFFRPVMRVLGLPERTAVLWVPAAIFGLVYGGAVIIEESKRGALTKEELERLHISIGINHSMVEDPALFLALGLNCFWLLVPKFVTAVIAVQVYGAVKYLRKEVAPRWIARGR
jgi:hypothetical protein